MADYKFTQTGAEIQALLNLIPNKATLYRHELSFTTAPTGYVTDASDKIVLISTDSSPYTLNDIDENDATGVLRRSKILAMYLYKNIIGGKHCYPILYLNVAGTNVELTVLGLSTTLSQGSLEDFVSDTVTQI